MASNNALGVHSKKHRVAIVGSGNWGTTIAKVVGENVAENPDLFEQEVRMWVFEEEYTIPKNSKHYDANSELSTKPQKLTELINGLHENVKYLPGVPLPKNIVANPDLVNAVEGATILVFNLPHQFIARTCQSIVGKIVPFARGTSCIKGVKVSDEGCELFSESIGHELGIYCGALSGANIANEVAQEKWSETTVAYDPPKMDSKHPTPEGTPHGSQLDLTKLNVQVEGENNPSKKRKVQPQLQPMPNEYPPLHHDNAKAAVMRVGIMEEVRFGKMFFSESTRTETFTEESCGVADLITSCSGGRNFRCAKMSVAEGKPIGEIEERELNGQKLQGTSTAYEVYSFLCKEGKEKEFPLFTAVRNVLEGINKPQDIPDLLEAGTESQKE